MHHLKTTVLLLILSTLFLQVSAQKTEAEIVALNKVNKDKSKFLMMSNSLTKTGSIADQLWLVASQKGEKDGKSCLLVKSPKATTWTALAADIKYFRYQEGFEYKIMLKQEQFTDESKADEYRLSGILAKKKKKSDLRSANEQGTFENTTWAFTEYEGKKVESGYIKFYGNNISASAGCNSMSGMSFKANPKKSSLKFTNANKGMMTCMACADQEVMKRESRLFAILQEVTTYEATANKLTLKNGGKTLMILKR